MSRQISQDKIDLIIKLYSEGKSTIYIQKHHGIGVSTSVKYLRLHNIPIRRKNTYRYPKPTALPEDKIKQVCEEYLAGASSRELSRRWHVSDNTILKYLRENGIKTRSPSEYHYDATARRALTDEQVDEAVELYEGGWTSGEIGRHFHCTASTVRKYLKLRGLQMRPKGGSKPRHNKRYAKEMELTRMLYYEKKLTIAEIADILGIKATTLHSRMAAARMEIRSPSEATKLAYDRGRRPRPSQIGQRKEERDGNLCTT